MCVCVCVLSWATLAADSTSPSTLNRTTRRVHKGLTLAATAALQLEATWRVSKRLAHEVVAPPRLLARLRHLMQGAVVTVARGRACAARLIDW